MDTQQEDWPMLAPVMSAEAIAVRQRALEYMEMTEAEWALSMVKINFWCKETGRPSSTNEELAAEHGLPLEMILTASQQAEGWVRNGCVQE